VGAKLSNGKASMPVKIRRATKVDNVAIDVYFNLQKAGIYY
jgi:hypothetical protein